jgi:hypothetical protein
MKKLSEASRRQINAHNQVMREYERLRKEYSKPGEGLWRGAIDAISPCRVEVWRRVP